ncbi:MAG: hypothetical protein KJI70_00680 [Patescibacteria group bacterium]|nr:hypothetical protein [Patescibacteria group bacterium]
MNKISKSLIVLFLAFLFGSSFGIFSIQAQNDKLILELSSKECDIQYSGESCIIELKLTNNTDKILNGETSLHIDYKGICGDGFFDGEGIKAQFSITDNSWLDFLGWKDGTTAVSGFEIVKGETQSKLKIKTASNLCPGEYTFILELKGTTAEEEYTSIPLVMIQIGDAIILPQPFLEIPEIDTTDTEKIVAVSGEEEITTLTKKDSETEFIGEKEEEKEKGEEKVVIEGIQKGLVSMIASIGMIWGEISKSAFLTIIVILCLMGLVLIGIKEWRLFQKKKEERK